MASGASAHRRRHDASKWIAKFSRRLILGIACHPLCTNRALFGQSDYCGPPRSGLYRPIFTQFSAEARRIAQDHAGPFCTMKVRTARGFCANRLGPGQTGLLGRSPVGQIERKEEMKTYPSDRERSV